MDDDHQFSALCSSFGLDVHTLQNFQSSMTDREQRIKEQQKITRRMLRSEELGDVVFICSDGVRVPGIRMLVCAGCPVFKSMLMNGMRESWQKEVSLPEVSSCALRIILDFLYFGYFRLHKEPCKKKQWLEGLQTIKAARFLLMESLETMVWKVLLADLCAAEVLENCNVIRLSVVSDFIEEYDHLPDSVARNLGVISSRLLSSVTKKWLSAIELQEMSQSAFLVWMKHLNSKEYDGNVLRMDVYLRFRQVVLWCACQLYELEMAEAVVNSHLPSGLGALLLVQSHLEGHPLELCAMLEPGETFSSKDVLDACVEANFETNFLPFLDTHRMHPVLLLKVIEPLGIITNLDLLPILRAHVLNGVDSRSKPSRVLPKDEGQTSLGQTSKKRKSGECNSRSNQATYGEEGIQLEVENVNGFNVRWI